MRYFEKLQHNLIAYRDALSGDWEISDGFAEDIEKLENTILENRPATYRYITDRITSLIDYVRDMRQQQKAVDMSYVAECIDEIYYVCGIADHGASSATDNYKPPAMYVPKMPQNQALVKQPGQEKKPDMAPIKPKEIINISNMPRGARYIFENNPFCVLGISASSSRADALKIRDKLQKLDHLGAADSYASPFDLANVEKPNRELGRLQVVLENINDLRHRWLWFRKAEFYVSMWDSFKRYYYAGEGFDYNRLIAVYFCLLITDAQMAHAKNIKTIVLYYVAITR